MNYAYLLTRIVHRLELCSPDTAIFEFLYTNDLTLYPQDLIAAIGLLEQHLMLLLESGAECDQFETELGISALFLICCYEYYNQPEKCDELTIHQDQVVKNILDKVTDWQRFQPS